MGRYGLSWDRLGVKSVRRRRSRPARADLRILLMGFRLKEWLKGDSRSLQPTHWPATPPRSQANSSRGHSVGKLAAFTRDVAEAVRHRPLCCATGPCLGEFQMHGTRAG